MVDIELDEKDFAVAFIIGQMDTVVKNLKETVENIDTADFRYLEVHGSLVQQLDGYVKRLNSHLSDLREYLREKKPPLVLWSRTTPKAFDTERIE